MRVMAVAQYTAAAGHPAKAVGGEQLQRRLAHAAFRRPQARRPAAEHPIEGVQPVLDMPLRPGRTAWIVGGHWQVYVGHGLARAIHIQQQGDDGVRVRAHAQLNLSLLRQLPVARHD